MLVVVPFYNCVDWLERALQSLATQTYKAEVVLADDGSTDGSSEIAMRYAKLFGWHHRKSSANLKCPYNIWAPIQEHEGDDDEPIFILDGDDYLPHDDVLKTVAKVYEDPNIWLAYGSYASDPFDPQCAPARDYPWDVIQRREFRKEGNLFNHPLTWRKWLFNQIPEYQMKTPDGRWFKSGYDRVFMWPMLELATEHGGQRHWTVMSDILYVYNSVNPQSEVYVNMDALHESEISFRYPILNPAVHP